MPFIDSKITVPVDDATKELLKAEFGKTMSLIGKSETFLMVGINDNYDLWMGGKKHEKGSGCSGCPSAAMCAKIGECENGEKGDNE